MALKGTQITKNTVGDVLNKLSNAVDKGLSAYITNTESRQEVVANLNKEMNEWVKSQGGTIDPVAMQKEWGKLVKDTMENITASSPRSSRGSSHSI